MSATISDSISNELIRLASLVYLVLRHNVFASINKDNVHVTPLQWEILRIVQLEEKIHMAEVGSRLCISRPQITRLVDKLLSYGLVERQESTSDRRMTYIILTKKGEAYIAEVYNLMRSTVNQALSQILDQKSVELLNSSISVVSDSLQKLIIYETRQK